MVQNAGEEIPVKILDNEGGSAEDQTAEGSGGFFITGDLQAEASKAPIGDDLGFPATGREFKETILWVPSISMILQFSSEIKPNPYFSTYKAHLWNLV